MKPQKGLRDHWAMFSIVFAVACMVFIAVVRMTGVPSEVVEVYFGYANNMMDGMLPFVDFDAEYPPFAFVFMFIPRLFASSAFGYEVAFMVEVFAFFVIGLWYAGKLAKKHGKSPYFAMLVYSSLIILMLEFAIDRYDIFPVVLVLISLYCLVTKRYVLAWILLSLATMTKLYPALLFPIYLIPFLMDRDWKNAIRGVVVFFLTSVAILMPFLLTDPGSVMVFLEYHFDRPLEIESTAGSMISVASLLGFTDVSFGFDFGSNNIYGAWPDLILPYLTPLMLASVLAVYAWMAYSFSRLKRSGKDTEDNRMMVMGIAMFMSVALFVVVGKVFSGQYMLWFIPLILFMAILPMDHAMKRNMLYLFVSVELLTQMNFWVNFGLTDLTQGISEIGAAVLLARNVLMILVMVATVMGMKRHTDRICSDSVCDP